MKPVKKEKHTPKHYLPDTTPKIAAAGATVLVLLVVLSFVLSSGWMHGSSTGIILPGSEGDSPTVGTGSALLTGQSVDDITIDVNNAKTVIATLTRPAAYSSRIENTIYYDGGSAALYCHRYVRDNVMRTDTLGSDNQVQSTLIRVPDSKVYAWNAGDSTAYQGKAGDFTDDAAAMLPTYEDVLADEVQLTAAGRQDINGERIQHGVCTHPHELESYTASGNCSSFFRSPYTVHSHTMPCRYPVRDRLLPELLPDSGSAEYRSQLQPHNRSVPVHRFLYQFPLLPFRP